MVAASDWAAHSCHKHLSVEYLDNWPTASWEVLDPNGPTVPNRFVFVSGFPQEIDPRHPKTWVFVSGIWAQWSYPKHQYRLFGCLARWINRSNKKMDIHREEMMNDQIPDPQLTWVFPKIVVPQNGRFIVENPIKMGDLGVPLFSETSISQFFTVVFVSLHFRWLVGNGIFEPSR